MQYIYSISEFNMLLKLGIWETGIVKFWGQVDTIGKENNFFHSVSANRYDTASLIRKHLDTGLYLLDLFFTGRDTTQGVNSYRLVIAVCRNDMAHLETLHHIQVSNSIPAGDFFSAVNRDDVALESFHSRSRRFFNHPSRIQTRLTPVWEKVIFRN